MAEVHGESRCRISAGPEADVRGRAGAGVASKYISARSNLTSVVSVLFVPGPMLDSYGCSLHQCLVDHPCGHALPVELSAVTFR